MGCCWGVTLGCKPVRVETRHLEVSDMVGPLKVGFWLD